MWKEREGLSLCWLFFCYLHCREGWGKLKNLILSDFPYRAQPCNLYYTERAYWHSCSARDLGNCMYPLRDNSSNSVLRGVLSLLCLVHGYCLFFVHISQDWVSGMLPKLIWVFNPSLTYTFPLLKSPHPNPLR